MSWFGFGGSKEGEEVNFEELATPKGEKSNEGGRRKTFQ